MDEDPDDHGYAGRHWQKEKDQRHPEKGNSIRSIGLTREPERCVPRNEKILASLST